MTTLLAYHDPETMTGYIASDGQCTAGNLRISSASEKTVRAGGWLVGVTGYSLMAKILRHSASDLASCATVWELSNAIHSLLLARDWRGKPEDDGSGPASRSGWMLVVSAGGSWIIFGNGDPERFYEPTGGGSGGDLATGAAMAFIAAGFSVAESLLRGLAIAVDRDTYSGGRLVLEDTNGGPARSLQPIPIAGPGGITC